VESAFQGAMVEGMDAKQVHTWNRYQLYLLSIGLLDDLYLDSYDRAHKRKILSAFAHSIRDGRVCNRKTKSHLGLHGTGLQVG
jgi:hypothetical protein